ncbi:MAG: hypothetical protein GC179_30655 [Anaerolineaceae bacterium]|nr:hypothetical protein [Anaerolineaceae bacterium]
MPKERNGADPNSHASDEQKRAKKAKLQQWLKSLDPDQRKKAIAALKRKQEQKKLARQDAASSPDSAPPRAVDADPPGASPALPPPRRESESARADQAASARVRKDLAGRTPSSRILPMRLYGMAKSRLLKKRVLAAMVVALLSLLCAGWILYMGAVRGVKDHVIEAADRGLEALHQDRLDAARDFFDAGLNLFRQYNSYPRMLDGSASTELNTAALNIGQGFRSLGEIESAVRTFQLCAAYAGEEPASWQAASLSESLEELIRVDHWSLEQDQRLYKALLEENPRDWRAAATKLVYLTERVSRRLKPLTKRYQEAEIVLYGSPRRVSDASNGEFVVDVKSIYKVDWEDTLIYIQPAGSLSDRERARLNWYLDANQPCLFFVGALDHKGVIDSIDDVILSVDGNVEEFDAVVQSLDVTGS